MSPTHCFVCGGAVAVSPAELIARAPSVSFRSASGWVSRVFPDRYGEEVPDLEIRVCDDCLRAHPERVRAVTFERHIATTYEEWKP